MGTCEMEDLNVKVLGMRWEEMTAASSHTENTEPKMGDGLNKERKKRKKDKTKGVSY